jgi:Fe-S oxidoreductase
LLWRGRRSGNVFPKISKDIGDLKIKEIEETGAEVVLSACQQCKRTISLNAKKMKKSLGY